MIVECTVETRDEEVDLLFGAAREPFWSSVGERWNVHDITVPLA